MAFDFESIKDILCCPKSHTPLALVDESLICTDAECRLKFDIRDDIPILLLDEARELSVEEWENAMRGDDSPRG